MNERMERNTEKGMSYEGFEKCIVMDLQRMLGSDVKVLMQDVIKNNDTKLKGLTVVSHDTNISPTIYLDYYYSQYEKGRALDEIEQELICIYKQNKVNANVEVSFFTEWQRVKDNIVFKLVNYKRNQELLKDVPHIRFLDLAIVFNCLLEANEKGNATILIHNHHLKYWNVTKDDLHIVATENTPKLLQCDLRNIVDVITNMLSNDNEIGNAEENICPMYVLSNIYKLNGASCILYQNVLKDFSEKVGSDLYILPSSTHEVLLVPVMDEMSHMEFSEMVKEINATQVLPEEILSDHPYKYVRALDKIIM